LRAGIRRLLFSFAMLLSITASGFELDRLESEDVRLIYIDPIQTHLLPHVMRSYHNSISFQKTLFGWLPWDKPSVILMDTADYNNAGVGVSPFNVLSTEISPSNHIYETTPESERFFNIMNHEAVHLATLDAWNETDRKWRKFFGGKVKETKVHPETIIYAYLTTPRLGAPRWYSEGSATFMETWMTGGMGRAQGAYDEMVFRAMVRDRAPFYSALGLVSEGMSIDFQAGVNAYLYGTRFFSYLALNDSPEQVVQLLRRDEGSQRYYSRQFLDVFGKPIEEAWEDWIAWEHEFQEENLARLRTTPLTHSRRLSDRALGSVSKSFIDPVNRTMIGAFQYPGVYAHVGVLNLDSGVVEHVVDIKDPALYRVSSLAYDASTQTVFYTSDNNQYRDLMSVRLDTGEVTRLIGDARIGDLAYNPTDRSLWGTRHLNGYVTLVRMPYPYEEWDQVHTFPYGIELFELDVSSDGSMLSGTYTEFGSKNELQVFRIEDLTQGRIEPIAAFDFGQAVPEGFVFTPDGRYLFGTSYYTGVSNVFRFELETGEVEAVSNAETGYFRPMPLEDGSLIVLEYTGQGFTPVQIDPVPLQSLGSIRFLGNEIAQQHPVVRDWNVVSTLDDHDLEDIPHELGKYQPLKELGIGSRYPVIEGYRGDAAVGYHVGWQDPLGIHSFEATASYSPSSEGGQKLHAYVGYESMHWRAYYVHNYADFYDLFGPTERSRKGDGIIIGYQKNLIYDAPRNLDFSATLSWYTGLDTLPDNQNRPTFFFDQILSFDANLSYRNRRSSIGAVDREKGWGWHLSARADHSEFDTIPKLRAGLEFGFSLPWKHSSIWLYSTVGWADGNRLDPLTNFYFGGFGNNYVDDGPVKRYRSYYSLPGFEIGEIAAREFGKVTAELNLPPIRFEEAGQPSLFLKYIRPSLFVTGLIADPGKIFERKVYSAGGQLDLAFTLVHRLPMTLSIGWAAGFENGSKRDDEWMLSLKIL